ncbi:MAG: hypothetical protein J5851_00930 [Oscillospiraceae bacterium]|nr:hypothetical protein [Oscillospiraceae bacterium]
MGKKTKIASLLYCGLMVAACALPGLLLLRPAEDTGAENRQLAAFPSFLTEDGSFNRDFGDQFQAYVSDHFGFRQQLVTANSNLRYHAFGMSAEENVIVGKNGWLYYTPTVKDYIHDPTVSDLGICNIIHNLEMMQDYAASQGAGFTVLVVPNKNTIYPAQMPSRYVQTDNANNLERLTEAVQSTDLHWCPAETALRDASASQLQYHKTDTHWNNAGALTGYRALLDTMDHPGDRYTDTPYHTENIWEGDLQKMVFPESEALDEQVVYDIGFTYQYQGRYKDSDDITINTRCSTGDGSLLMFRDSFGAAIIPYLSESFQTARYSRARPNPLFQAEGGQFNEVVLEIVERNIDWLQKEAPLHAAPEVAAPTADGTCVATLYTEQNGNWLHLYGTAELPMDTKTAPHYYVTLQLPDGERTYLAYNCYEADLLGDDTVRDNGFSLYLPAETVGTEPISVTLTVETEQTVQSCDLGTVQAE